MNWPRPPKDNGLGIHWADVTLASLETYLPIAKALHLKWIVLCDGDPVRIGKVASVLSAEGIMPIARPDSKINGNRDFRAAAKQCNSPYVLVFNEFSDDREWRGGRRPDNWRFIAMDKWIGGAHAVRSVGCYPGLQVMSPDELSDMLSWMEAGGDDVLWPDMWIALHQYSALGCPPDCTKHGEYDILGFQGYADVCLKQMGYVPPMIVTEGGYTDGQGTPQDRAKWMTEIFGWFRDGMITTIEDSTCFPWKTHHELLPDYLFAFCPWILFSVPIAMWYGFSWTQNEKNIPMLEAVKAMGEFERGKPALPEEAKDWRVVSPWMATQDATDVYSSVASNPRCEWTLEERK